MLPEISHLANISSISIEDIKEFISKYRTIPLAKKLNQNVNVNVASSGQQSNDNYVTNNNYTTNNNNNDNSVTNNVNNVSNVSSDDRMIARPNNKIGEFVDSHQRQFDFDNIKPDILSVPSTNVSQSSALEFERARTQHLSEINTYREMFSQISKDYIEVHEREKRMKTLILDSLEKMNTKAPAHQQRLNDEYSALLEKNLNGMFNTVITNCFKTGDGSEYLKSLTATSNTLLETLESITKKIEAISTREISVKNIVDLTAVEKSVNDSLVSKFNSLLDTFNEKIKGISVTTTQAIPPEQLASSVAIVTRELNLSFTRLIDKFTPQFPLSTPAPIPAPVTAKVEDYDRMKKTENLLEILIKTVDRIEKKNADAPTSSLKKKPPSDDDDNNASKIQIQNLKSEIDNLQSIISEMKSRNSITTLSDASVESLSATISHLLNNDRELNKKTISELISKQPSSISISDDSIMTLINSLTTVISSMRQEMIPKTEVLEVYRKSFDPDSTHKSDKLVKEMTDSIKKIGGTVAIIQEQITTEKTEELTNVQQKLKALEDYVNKERLTVSVSNAGMVNDLIVAVKDLLEYKKPEKESEIMDVETVNHGEFLGEIKKLLIENKPTLDTKQVNEILKERFGVTLNEQIADVLKQTLKSIIDNYKNQYNIDSNEWMKMVTGVNDHIANSDNFISTISDGYTKAITNYRETNLPEINNNLLAIKNSVDNQDKNLDRAVTLFNNDSNLFKDTITEMSNSNTLAIRSLNDTNSGLKENSREAKIRINQLTRDLNVAKQITTILDKIGVTGVDSLTINKIIHDKLDRIIENHMIRQNEQQVVESSKDVGFPLSTYEANMSAVENVNSASAAVWMVDTASTDVPQSFANGNNASLTVLTTEEEKQYQLFENIMRQAYGETTINKVEYSKILDLVKYSIENKKFMIDASFVYAPALIPLVNEHNNMLVYNLGRISDNLKEETERFLESNDYSKSDEVVTMTIEHIQKFNSYVMSQVNNSFQIIDSDKLILYNKIKEFIIDSDSFPAFDQTKKNLRIMENLTNEKTKITEMMNVIKNSEKMFNQPINDLTAKQLNNVELAGKLSGHLDGTLPITTEYFSNRKTVIDPVSMLTQTTNADGGVNVAAGVPYTQVSDQGGVTINKLDEGDVGLILEQTSHLISAIHFFMDHDVSTNDGYDFARATFELQVLIDSLPIDLTENQQKELNYLSDKITSYQMNKQTEGTEDAQEYMEEPTFTEPPPVATVGLRNVIEKFFKRNPSYNNPYLYQNNSSVELTSEEKMQLSASAQKSQIASRKHTAVSNAPKKETINRIHYNGFKIRDRKEEQEIETSAKVANDQERLSTKHLAELTRKKNDFPVGTRESVIKAIQQASGTPVRKIGAPTNIGRGITERKIKHDSLHDRVQKVHEKFKPVLEYRKSFHDSLKNGDEKSKADRLINKLHDHISQSNKMTGQGIKKKLMTCSSCGKSNDEQYHKTNDGEIIHSSCFKAKGVTKKRKLYNKAYGEDITETSADPENRKLFDEHRNALNHNKISSMQFNTVQDDLIDSANKIDSRIVEFYEKSKYQYMDCDIFNEKMLRNLVFMLCSKVNKIDKYNKWFKINLKILLLKALVHFKVDCKQSIKYHTIDSSNLEEAIRQIKENPSILLEFLE